MIMSYTQRVYVVILIALLLSLSETQKVSLISGNQRIPIMQNGIISSKFLERRQMNCSPLDLYIYYDFTLKHYQIEFMGIKPSKIQGLIKSLSYQTDCEGGSCNVTINNLCHYKSINQMNIVQIQIFGYTNINYIVNCSPSTYYKPFQWGLFLLILLCTITITFSSKYSHAWSYGGFAININAYWVVSFTMLVIFFCLVSFFLSGWVSRGLKIFGSVMGSLGVMVCVVESLWQTNYQSIKQRILWIIRPIDIIGVILGITLTILYWQTKGNWIINNILGICTVVMCIKFFKIRSLQIGIVILTITVLIQITAGLFVHYVVKQSYNNLVINMFQSPIVIVLPSITPELFRRCAWIPLSNVIFPGLIISYLRRFDMSRSTNIYLIFGYFSYYLGSLLWMMIDMMTIHTLPIAIVSDSFMLIVLSIISLQRNDFKILWKGTFYDEENPDFQKNHLKNSSKASMIDIKNYTANLKIDSKDSIESDTKSRITI